MDKLKLTFPILPESTSEYIDGMKAQLASRGSNKKKFLITSPSVSESKSYVSAELWRSLAEVGVRTCLVDLDYTNNIHRDKYGMSSDVGSFQDYSDRLFSTDIENGDIALLRDFGSELPRISQEEDFVSFLNKLAEEYRYVILDAPPLDSVTSNSKLSALCDVSITLSRKMQHPISHFNLHLDLPQLPYAVDEALKKLRTNIKFCGQDTKKIQFVSSIPNEGKSFISLHLWKMLAESDTKAVFVDLDFRNSVLNKKYNIKVDSREFKGIDHYLSGQAEYEEIIYTTNVENGDFVPIANLLENPSSLFESKRFAEFLNRLAEDYRYVILDCPPMVGVADSGQIATLCDGAVMIVRSGFTSRKLIRESLQQLERVECSLLGMVLNREPVPAKGYGKYGYGKYGYGKYGYGYGRYGYGHDRYGYDNEAYSKNGKKKRR